MIKAIALLTIAISIYDIPHDSKHLLIEGCSDYKKECVSIKVPRSHLEDPKALDAIANHLQSQLN